MDNELLKSAPWRDDPTLNLKQKNFLCALKASLCVVSTAVEMYRKWEDEIDFKTRLSKNSHERWIKEEDGIYLNYFLDLRSEVKDFGESCLHQLMRGHRHKKTTTRITPDGTKIIEEEEWRTPPDKSAVIFFNKTQNKDRGYVERQELTTPEGIKIEMMAPVILEIKEATNMPTISNDEAG